MTVSLLCLTAAAFYGSTATQSGAAEEHLSAAARAGTRDGTIFFSDRRHGEIWKVRPDGTARHRVSRHGSVDSSVGVARRKDRVVFTRLTGYFRIDVFSARRDGSRLRRLTRSRRHAIGEDAAISPDGSLIVFIKHEALWIMRADGSEARRLVGYGGHDYVQTPSFSPDGTKIAFNHTILTPTGPAENEELVIVDIDGSDRNILGPRYDEVTAPRFSPSGAEIIYGCGDDDRHGLCMIGPEGQQHAIFRQGTGQSYGGVSGRSGTTAAWSPSGDEIVFDCRRERLCIVGTDGTHFRVLGRGSMPDWG